MIPSEPTDKQTADPAAKEWRAENAVVFSAPIFRSTVEVEDYDNTGRSAVMTTKAGKPKAIGHVYLELSTVGVSNLKNSLIKQDLLIALAGLTIASFFAWWIGRSITRPILTLSGAVRKIAEGDLKQRVAETSSDELGDLEHGFNDMTMRLQQARDTMQERIDEATSLLSYQAQHDALTGLVNRREFEQRLERALVRACEHDTQHVFCYMDLDQFKIVNDTCGHSAGDELLRQITLILSSRVRERDTLARLGGDEFGLLLEKCTIADAYSIAEEMRQMVCDFRYTHQDKVFTIGASIGMVPIDRNTLSMEYIMSAADAACYTAKENGRNRIHLFQMEDGDMIKRSNEMHWPSRIALALEEERFCLYCQPILPLDDGSEGRRYFEVLLRKVSTDGQLIPPMAFIPAAERFQMMNSIDRWVIRRTLATYRRLLDGGYANYDCVFSINLSGTSLGDKTLIDFITEQFDRNRIPPHGICFEITETSAIVNLTNTVVLMNSLNNIGCRFMLDDFGSGMSSFTYLKNLPVDFLKIDGTFVKDIATNPIDRAMVESIHGIASAMNIKTIAEYVEGADALEILKSIGVHYGQGFYLDKPVSLDHVVNKLCQAT